MRLGFDLDGTLADLQRALAREARSLFPGIDPATLPQSTAPAAEPGGSNSAKDEAEAEERFSTRTLTARQQRELWDRVCDRENFWELLDEIEPGALARLARLVHARKWELIFVTS